jgi:DNA-binding FadR family transcriptional regulator
MDGAASRGSDIGDDSVRRPRVQQALLGAIASDICSDVFPPGAMLPTENELCLRYGVSRTVVREALKTLQSKGMVQGRSRVGTQVCPTREWNILDAQVLAWIGPRIFDLDLLQCILDARRATEPYAAELAAERATMGEIAEIEAAWQRMHAAEDDVEAFTAADVAFHAGIMKASHNRVFMQLSGIIQAAMEFVLHASNEAVEARGEAVEIHRALIEALRMRDRAAARACSMRMLDLSARDLSIAISRHVRTT